MNMISPTSIYTDSHVAHISLISLSALRNIADDFTLGSVSFSFFTLLIKMMMNFPLSMHKMCTKTYPIPHPLPV